MPTGATIGWNVDHLLDYWEAAVREKVTALSQVRADEVRGNVPAILGLIQSDYGGSSSASEIEAAAARHGEIRAKQGLDADVLCVEFEILRRELMRSLFNERNGRASVDDVNQLCAALDRAHRHAASAICGRRAEALKASQGSFLDFLSFISHELRGGLNGVLLLAEVIRRELASRPDLGECVSDLDMLRGSLLGTVANLERCIYAERFRRGKIGIRIASIDLRDVIAEVVKRLAFDAKECAVAIQVEAASASVVNSDRTLVSLIACNLLLNAIKSGSGEVRVRISSANSADDRFQISFTDTGRGIPKEKLAALLSPTKEQDDAVTAKTGLGLFNVRHAARLVGAKLTGESVVGKGSTFCMELPREAKVLDAQNCNSPA